MPEIEEIKNDNNASEVIVAEEVRISRAKTQPNI
jgi:hypothetical protein